MSSSDSNNATLHALQGLAIEDPSFVFSGESSLGIAPSVGVIAADAVDSTVVQPPVSIGKGFAFIREPEFLCLGCVGTTKTKFCVEAKGKCEITAHKEKGKM